MYFSALLCLLSIIASADSVGDCISNYKELRENVFSRYKNKMELQNTFYPVNSLRPDTVVVTYKISSPDNPNPTSQNEEYIFRWSSAKAFTFIRPDLLALLSVYVYVEFSTEVTLWIDPFCKATQFFSNATSFSDFCFTRISNRSHPIIILNQLTGNLRMLVQNDGQNKFDRSFVGYSSFLFNKDNGNDNCVVEKEKTMEGIRIIVYALILISVFSVWLGTMSSFSIILDYINDWTGSTNNRLNDRDYFLRGILLTSCVVVLCEWYVAACILYNNLWKHPKSIFSDIIIYNIVAAVLVFPILPCLNYAAVNHRSFFWRMKLGFTAFVFTCQLLALNLFYFLLALSVHLAGSVFILLNYFSMVSLLTVWFRYVWESYHSSYWCPKWKHVALMTYLFVQNYGIFYVAIQLEMRSEIFSGVVALIQLYLTVTGIVRTLKLND